jgi:hypothetical protein
MPRRKNEVPMIKSSNMVQDEKKINLSKLRNPNIMQQISSNHLVKPGEDSDVPYISDLA